MNNKSVSKEFFWRRIHSLAGLWLIFFIIEHLLTNSQSALFLGDDGHGFIATVNWIHGLPYLPVIELVALGVPFLIHGLWGLKYAREAKINSLGSDESRPTLGQYKENRAFTWQRVTSWILIIGVIAHVVQMRFLDYPAEAQVGKQDYYAVRVSQDPGLQTLAVRLDFQIFTESDITRLKSELSDQPSAEDPVAAQTIAQEENFVAALEGRPLSEGEVIVVAKDFGTASLMVVRDTFKIPMMIVLYTIFVIAAGYHAFNGLWTAFITWGVTITQRTQDKFRKLTNALMALVIFLGLASVWLTYVNLSQ